MINATKPLVSIICNTYNHENFIRECLNGFIIQRTNFPIEIIVHDDASSDNTVSIIQEYESKHPDLFSCLYQKENQYSNKDVNIWSDITFPLVRGKYIALCEGDDYWTDPMKLQKQVDTILNNPNCKIVYHNCGIIDEKGLFLGWIYDRNYNKKLRITDLILGDFTKTCTMLFENNKDIISTKLIDDTILGMLLLENGGEAWYLEDVMSNYRVHNGGVWSKKSQKQRILEGSQNHNFIVKRYENRFPKEINERIKQGNLNSAMTLLRENELTHFYKYFKEYIIREKNKLAVIKAIFSVSKVFFKTSLINLNYRHEKK
jgi:glycosyltransferase involved in cell wall biosynthesis